MMTACNKYIKGLFYLSLLAFFLFVVYILHTNQEVFYTAHNRSEFLFGAPFFHTLMSKPFGLILYIGAWFTQLFYHPAFGSGVLVVIWVLIFLVGVKAFRLQGSAAVLMLLPVACLLTSVVDLGYWIYISNIRGYWFSQSIGYLLMLLLLLIARQTPRKWHIVWYVIGFCIYPVLGWFALLLILCLILVGKPTWRELVGVVLIAFAAYIWHTQYYSNLKFDDVVLAGLPRFITPSDNAEHLAIPFWVLGFITLLLPLCGRYLNKWYVPILCTLTGIIFTWSLMFQDQNYIDEMRMVRYAEDDNWKEVLKLAEGNKKLTSSMMFLKNVALMNEGGLLDRSFKLSNDAVNINNPDSLHVALFDIASPLVYYNYGIMNEAIRLSYEKTIQAGLSPYYLKILSRCARATGEEKLQERFTDVLHQQPFYDQWQPAPVTAKIRDLQHAYQDELIGVENSDSYIVNTISLWSDSVSKVASEQALFYAMLRCDSRRFWASLRNYVKAHIDEEFPVHAQEAYCLFMEKAPEKKRIILPIHQDVYNRYLQFWDSMKKLVKPGANLRDIGERMRGDFGDTYWWYNIFGRKFFVPNGFIHSEVQS